MKKFFLKGINKCAGYRLKPILNPDVKLQKLKITPISASRIYYDDQRKKDEIPSVHLRMKFFGIRK